MSPLLFIMAQQIFSFNLKRAEQIGQLKSYKLGRNVQAVSHLFFADDMLIFSNGRVRSLKNLSSLLQKYENSSGQQINLRKSSIFASKQIHGQKLMKIQQVLGCRVKNFPFTYLGAPLYKGRCKSEYFDKLIQMVVNKLEGWKTKFISFAGKITLIKSALAFSKHDGSHDVLYGSAAFDHTKAGEVIEGIHVEPPGTKENPLVVLG